MNCLPNPQIAISLIICISFFYLGNWSPSDFPKGSTFTSYKESHLSINRDLLVVMEGDSVVEAFQTVFENDWDSGTDWKPKH